MQNELINHEEELTFLFNSLVQQQFSKEITQDYFNIKERYIKNNSLSIFSESMHKNTLSFIEKLNNYSDHDNAYLWQEFFIKNENLSPVLLITYGYENIPLVSDFIGTQIPIFQNIYKHFREHKDWNVDSIIGSYYVFSKLVEFNNKDFIECIQKTGFQITDNSPEVYWRRGDKETLKFIFEIKLLDPHREDSKMVTQEVFRNILRKSPSCEEIQESIDFFENMGIKPDIETLNFFSKIFNKEYSKAENKENVFQKSYFFEYFNKDNNHLFYDSDVAVNRMITDLLDSDENETDNEETIKTIVSFLKNKGVYPDWSAFYTFYSEKGQYYMADDEALHFLKEILIHNSKEYLSETMKKQNIISNNNSPRL